MSVLFQIYWINVTVFNGVVFIEGGGLQRALLKIFSLLIVYVVLFKFFAVRALTHNLIVKLPLLYYMATVVVVTPFIYSNPYFMAVNLLLFAPLLCIDFSGDEGGITFEYLAKIITYIVCFQLVVDLILKGFELNLVGTVLGGMGNANTFGLHLIVAGLGLRFVFKSPILSNIVLLSTWGTGSLACAGLGSALVMQSIFINLWKNPSGAILTVVGVLIIVDSFAETILLGEFGPLQHAYMKLDGLMRLVLFGGDMDAVGSISGRETYTIQGLNLLKDNPWAVIFGHPNFMPFYSGDGFYVALAVTLGIPMMTLFLISHVYMIYIGLREKTPLSNFSAYVLVVFVMFFASNRILDYWPSGFIYILVVSYLLRRKTSLSPREPS